MIWEILIIGALVGITILFARRLPDLNESRAKKGFWSLALKSGERLSKIVRRRPPAAEINRGDDLEIAERLFEERDYKKAEKFFLKALAKDKANDKIYSRLGVIYLAQKKYRLARDCFKTALKIEPAIASRHYNLGLIYLKLKDKKNAGENFRRAFDLEPTSQKYYQMVEKYR